MLEISGGQGWERMGFRSYRDVHFPEFDVCAQVLDDRYDLIIADQVLEHVLWPYRAVRNIHAMLKPGGHALVTVPFLLRIHEEPVDCSRWTERGLRHLLAEGGFDLDTVVTGAWGNRACVRANFGSWALRGFRGSLRNEPAFPVVVWALAPRTA